MAAFVIRDACLITMNDADEVTSSGSLVVDNERITQIGEHVTPPAGAEEISGQNCILMPGFIDTHRHLWQTAIRGQLADCSLGDYFRRVMIGLAPTVTADEVYAGTLLGCYQLLDAGITGVVDWANIINTPEHADAGVKALLESGVRAVYAHGWPGGSEYLFHNELPHPDDARRVARQYFGASDQLVTMGLGLRGPVSNPPETLKSDWALGRDIGARLNVHAGMKVPGVTSKDITVLDDAGLLGADSTYVHCTNTTDREFARIAETGGHVSVAAFSEMVMGHGHPPTQRLLDAGLLPSISADTVASSPGDMFSLMRAVLTQARASTFSPEADEFNPGVDAAKTLAFATRNGAAALGRAGEIGVLAPGMYADLVMLRVDTLGATPLIDPIGTVVTQLDTSSVDSAWVAGRQVKRDGALVGVDKAHLKSLAATVAGAVSARLSAI